MHKYLRLIALYTLPFAYLLSVAGSITMCHPATPQEFVGATLLSLVLCIEFLPYAWLALIMAGILVASPLIICAWFYKKAKRKDNPAPKTQHQHLSTTSSAEAYSDIVDADDVTEVREAPRIAGKSQLSKIAKKSNLPKKLT